MTKLEASGFEVRKVDFVVPEKETAKFVTSDEPFYVCRKPAPGQLAQNVAHGRTATVDSYLAALARRFGEESR